MVISHEIIKKLIGQFIEEYHYRDIFSLFVCQSACVRVSVRPPVRPRLCVCMMYVQVCQINYPQYLTLYSRSA
jgi:hypothetical protein